MNPYNDLLEMHHSLDSVLRKIVKPGHRAKLAVAARLLLDVVDDAIAKDLMSPDVRADTAAPVIRLREVVAGADPAAREVCRG